jgi:hypothetical protein
MHENGKDTGDNRKQPRHHLNQWQGVGCNGNEPRGDRNRCRCVCRTLGVQMWYPCGRLPNMKRLIEGLGFAGTCIATAVVYVICALALLISALVLWGKECLGSRFSSS